MLTWGRVRWGEIHGMRKGKGSLKNGGGGEDMDSRDERALKRVSIVEKWWSNKIKKAARQSKKLRKEGGS
jgi:hypothetical protein